MARKTAATDHQRATRAERLVRHYSRTPGFRGKPDCEADISDFLTELRHFCARRGLDFAEIVERSRKHYEAESKERDSKESARNQGGEPRCPNCRSCLEYEPNQDGACDWYCLKCGWSQHMPAASQCGAGARRKARRKVRVIKYTATPLGKPRFMPTADGGFMSVWDRPRENRKRRRKKPHERR